MEHDDTAVAGVAVPPVQVFRHGAAERWTLAICTGLFALLLLVIVWHLPPLHSVRMSTALLAAAGLAALAGLALMVAREAVAAFRLHIGIGVDAVVLRLPRRRGHVLLPAVDCAVPITSVEAVESRAEAFRQLGMVAIQQAYRLLLKDGHAIELGADRQFKQPLFGPAADLLARRRGRRVRHLGMVDGRPGLLAVVGTSVPAWSAPVLSDAVMERRIANSERWVRYLSVFAVVVTLLRLFTRR